MPTRRAVVRYHTTIITGESLDFHGLPVTGYGLTPDEVKLTCATDPPHMLIAPPTWLARRAGASDELLLRSRRGGVKKTVRFGITSSPDLDGTTMASTRKVAANRLNAKRSTGPRTVGGKAVARMNAVAHGLRAKALILPGESAADWDRHRAATVTALVPVGALEVELAERVAALTWRLRRVVGFETAAVAAGMAEAGAQARCEGEAAAAMPFPKPFGPRTYAVVRKELDGARDTASTFARTRDEFRRLLSDPSGRSIDGAEAVHLLREATGYTPRGEDEVEVVSDDNFLAAVGVPREWRDEPELWGGWTAATVLRGVAVIAMANGITAAALVERAIRETCRIVEAEERRAARLEAELTPLAAEADKAEKAARARSVLPDAAALDRMVRYEAHLNKQLVQTLHLLERLQATRAGNQLLPPIALDVTIDGPDALLAPIR